MGLEKIKESVDSIKPEKNNFKDIKPEKGMVVDKAREYVKSLFDDTEAFSELKDTKEILNELKEEYFHDLKKFSEFKETLPDKLFDVDDLKKVSSKEREKLHIEFDNLKDNLKKQWEEKNGIPWPKYDKDVYIINKDNEKVCIRERGMDYDVHHIQPLGFDGKNELSNITPMHARIHFDYRGIHKTGSAYDKIDKLLKGENEWN